MSNSAATTRAPAHSVIIDCDPGVDDAVALLMALSDPAALDIVGITTVAGNVDLAQATLNAGRILALARRRDVPLCAGCSRPIMRAAGIRSSVHGGEGLGGIVVAQSPVAPSTGHAVDFIIDTVLSAPGEITLCPIGPMTNVALAMIKEPRVCTAVREIIFMGGAAFGPGNASPVAEFNFLVDPHAAHVVMTSGAKLTMFGLDVTLKAVVTADELAHLGDIRGEIAAKTRAMLTAYGVGDPHLHDPCVVAHLLDPGMFRGVMGLVEIECNSPSTLGMSVVSARPRHLAGREPSCLIVTDLAERRLYALLASCLTRLQARIDGAA